MKSACTSEDAREVIAAANLICPMLAGRPPEIQSAILAELVSKWLAGNFVPGDHQKTDALRQYLLKNFTECVVMLTDINAQILGTSS